MVGEEAKAGWLQNCKFFLFTDNSTANSCFYCGSSKSWHLHALVLALQILKMTHGMTIHVIHVSRKRKIVQGTDGCSKGWLMEGVMTGHNMLSFVDLGCRAIKLHPPLLAWIHSWMEQPSPCTRAVVQGGHGITGGTCDDHKVWIPVHEPKNQLHLWPPQPPVADAALEELLKARHKRTNTFHVGVVPRLMAP
jgi:hypothetical protein